MGKKKLIILYGHLGKEKDYKYQNYIDYDYTCMYREFAEYYGDIIYLTPQKVKRPWEHSITNPREVIDFCHKRKNDIVWSVKHDAEKDKEIFSKIQNPTKYYYSCNNRNSYNKYATYSLIDTEDKSNSVPNRLLFLKGKNNKFWKNHETNRSYDYVLMGKRGDKNELYFIEQLEKYTSENRSILWIGGSDKWFDYLKQNGPRYGNVWVSHTSFCSNLSVRNYLNQACVGILYTEHPMEGFPQSFLEMTMCGIPVIYPTGAPINSFYYQSKKKSINVKFCNHKKSDLIKDSEKLLKIVKENPTISKKCSDFSASRYSLKKAYQRLVHYAK